MHLDRLLSECSAGASLHPGELGPPKTVGQRGGGCTPQHGTAAPAKHREQQKCTTYPLPCFPRGGLSKCKLPTPHRYLPHAGTYPTRVPTLSRKLPNVGQIESSHQQTMPSSHLALHVSKKPTPSCPNLRRAETRESSPCSPQHPRRSPQTPPQPFQPPRGNRTIRVMICLGRAWRTPQRCCASLVRGCAELADRSLFSDVVRGSFSFPLKMR